MLHEGKAWHQFLAIADCKECDFADGFMWTKTDDDGKLVSVAVQPCNKHQKMLHTQDWERSDYGISKTSL